MGSWKTENVGNDKYLIFSEEDGKAQLDSVLIGMMENNSVSGVMPFEQLSEGNVKSVRYAVKADKTSLSDYLEKETSKDSFITILSSICTTVMKMKRFMLDPYAVILEQDKIFVDKNSFEVSLIVNPVVSEYEKPDYNKFFKGIFISASFRQDEDNNYVADIISFVNTHKNISLSEFAQELEKIRNTKYAKPVQQSVSQQVLQTPPQQAVPTPVQEDISSQPIRPRQDNVVPQVQPIRPVSMSQPAEQLQQAMPMSSPVQQVSPMGNGIMNGFSQPPKIVQSDEDDFDDDMPTSILVEENNSANPMMKRLRTGELTKISKDKFIIGKDKATADYHIAGNPAISRHHAYIIKKNNFFYIADAGSKNHTFVNGRMIADGEEYQLNNKDKVKLANEEFLFTL